MLIPGWTTRNGLAAAIVALLLVMTAAGRGQLAASFYNVTGITTRVLPNAVQVTIRTDGTVQFGGDLDEFIRVEPNVFETKPTTSFRIRLLNARARLPAFVDIGAYPVDSAVVTLGTEELSRPSFAPAARADADLRVDINLRFFVPVRVQRFITERRSVTSDDETTSGIDFKPLLEPLDVSVELGQDRRSIIVTVVPDRADADRAARIRRSPPEKHNRRLSVKAAEDGKLRVDALHAPLAAMLDELAAAAKTPIVVGPDAAATDVSLHLPSATVEDTLKVLETAYGLQAIRQADGWLVARGSISTITERIPLRHLSPGKARLLFPDFLLPLLRADTENNALVASGSPELVARLRRDVARLDVPRQQVRVTVSAYEFTDASEARFALRAVNAAGNTTATLDAGAGEVVARLGDVPLREFRLAVDALHEKGRARLATEPNILVANGEEGSIFLGQQRYLSVLRTVRRQQRVEALRLNIGVSLTVAPTVGADGMVLLNLNPRVSTVDSTEAGTGLPTLGIREAFTSIRVAPGEAVIIAGLESDLAFETDRRFPPLSLPPPLGAKRDARTKTALVLLVRAEVEK